MNTGFNYGRMGLAGNAGLADMENKRRWDEMESNRLDSEGKSAALGSLLGALTGGGLAMYQDYKRGQDKKPMEKPPGDVVEKTVKASVEENTMPSILKDREVVDYSQPFSLGDEWDKQITSAFSKLPGRFWSQP